MTYHPHDSEEDEVDEFESYQKSLEGIKDTLVAHTKGIKLSYKRVDEELEVKILYLPTDEVSLQSARDVISHLKPGDELYINAHGNPKLIGIGLFTENAIDIVKNLKHLGLPKDFPPHISIWACNSGKIEERTSLNQQVRKRLTDERYTHVSVTGTNALLVTNKNKKNYPTYVGIRKTKRSGESTFQPLDDEPLNFKGTPITTQRLDLKGGVFTQNREVSKVKVIRFKEEEDRQKEKQKALTMRLFDNTTPTKKEEASKVAAKPQPERRQTRSMSKQQQGKS